MHIHQLYVLYTIFTQLQYKNWKIRLQKLIFESNIKIYMCDFRMLRILNFICSAMASHEYSTLWILSVPLPKKPQRPPPQRKKKKREPTFLSDWIDPYFHGILTSVWSHWLPVMKNDKLIFRQSIFYERAYAPSFIVWPAKLNFYWPRVMSAHSAIVLMFLCDVKSFTSFYFLTLAVTSG